MLSEDWFCSENKEIIDNMVIFKLHFAGNSVMIKVSKGGRRV